MLIDCLDSIQILSLLLPHGILDQILRPLTDGMKQSTIMKAKN